MKIIQITDHTGSGGVNSFVYDLCLAQAKAGANVTFIGIIDSKEQTAVAEIEELKKAGVHVLCLGAPGKIKAIYNYTGKLRTEIKKIAQNDICICNLHLKLSVLCGIMASIGLKNIKCVETYHNSYHHYHLQYALCYPFIEHYIAISKTCGEEMKRRFRTPISKMTVIPNGIDRERIRSLSTLSGNDVHQGSWLMSIGRTSYEKNFKTPMNVLSRICNDHLYYYIIGNGPQQKELVLAAKNNKNIIFCGWLPRKVMLHKLANADLVIISSLWEGRSILQLEAMALDKPLILSDVPALREVFDEPPLKENEIYRECKWGYLVKVMDEEGYRQAILSFLSLPEYSKQSMIKEIAMHSIQMDISQTEKDYEKVYINSVSMSKDKHVEH